MHFEKARLEGPEIDALRTELTALRQEIATRQEMIDRQPPVAEQRSFDRRINHISAPKVMNLVNLQSESMAALLVFGTEQRFKRYRQFDEAVEDYQKLVELYPATDAAQIARQRLTQLQTIEKPNRFDH